MLVKPIALYSCEIWGKRVKLEENIEKIVNTVWEKLHTKVCKNILGVHRKASNITTLAEIGRYPMYIPYRAKLCRAKVTNFSPGDENFARRIISPDE